MWIFLIGVIVALGLVALISYFVLRFGKKNKLHNTENTNDSHTVSDYYDNLIYVPNSSEDLDKILKTADSKYGDAYKVRGAGD